MDTIYVKCPIFLSDFNQIWSVSAGFSNIPGIKFEENSSRGGGALIHASRRMDGHDLRKVPDIFVRF